ncbi:MULTISPECIES: hypothetical protein [Moorena]|nr:MULTISPECIES: hypothetical protein [Moorena]NES82905.1 hypothetical protein [Moorena sp. SIO2B7]NEP33763.1 hypothetical protein [Moorena sp. SIO3B2]NEP68390.1 hypothetical protein [Moorena sp. SIO3A5]NEQ10349.1 hypothetical protein [Moorena sp. SIO4E2]NER91246.1 hypothetical protein [Moorena sp. SIO3A2]
MINLLKQLWTTLVSFTLNIRKRWQQLAATILKVFKELSDSNSQPIDQQSSSQESQEFKKLSQSSQLTIVMNYTPPNDGDGPPSETGDAGSLWKLYQLIHENPEFSNPQLLPISASRQLQLSQLQMVNTFTPPNDGDGPVGDGENAGSFCKFHQVIDENPECTDPQASSVTKSSSGQSTLPSDPVSPKPESKQLSTVMSWNPFTDYNPPKDGKGPVGDSKDAGSSWRR